MPQQGVRHPLTRTAAIAVILIAAIALTGWWTDHDALASLLPAIAKMTFNTAFNFLLLGLACVIHTPRLAHYVRLAIACLVAIIAALSLTQDLFAVNFGIDNLLFDSRPLQPDSPYPGRMSSVTSTGFLFSAISLYCMSLYKHLPRLSLLMHSLVLLVGLIGMLGLGINVLMGHVPSDFAHFASISPLTAATFLMLSAALLHIFHQHYHSHGHPILHTGISLMLALRYPQKFAIISVIFVIPLFMLIWHELDELEYSVQQASKKITAIEHLHQTIDLLNAIPEHRGMLNAHLTDQQLFRRALQQSNTKIDQLFADNDRMDQRQRRTIAIPRDWGEIEQRWLQIKQGSLDQMKAWRLHTEIIALLHKHVRDIGHSTHLAYDDDPTIHNLVSAQVDVLPQLFEETGQLRGLGAAILAGGSIDRNQQLKLSSALSRTRLLLNEYRQLIDSAWSDRHQLNEHLHALSLDFIAHCNTFLAIVEAQLIRHPTLSMASSSYFDLGSAALNTGLMFNHDSLKYVQQLLQQRITRSLNRQYIIKLAILLTALLLLYIFASFYQSMQRIIGMFNAAIEHIRAGKGNELQPMPARDEIVCAFNAMSAELVRINAKMSAIVDHAVDGIITINQQGIIESFNPAAEQLFGYTCDEVTGKNITMLMPERYRQRHRHSLEHYLHVSDSNIVGNSLDVHGLKKDGAEFPIDLSISTMLMEKQRSFIGIIRDTTRHHELEHELRQAQKMQAIGVLVGGVAHNFNNMLAGIIGQAYLAKMRCGGNERAITHLDTIEATSMQASDMVKQLLTFAHKDFLRDKQDISLDTLIREAVKTARLGISEDITLDLHIADGDWMVHCDADQIEQVVINILNNACDAVAESFPKRITVSLQYYQPDAGFLRRHPGLSRGPYAAVQISDSGPGMDDDTIEHIFEPFFTTKDVGDGTGLGLSTAFGSITSHHGMITVDSQPDPDQPDQGSTFYIYLPLIEPQAADAPQEQLTDVCRSRHGETLLVVDDEEIVLESMSAALQQLGYQVVTACDGRQGLQRFLEHQDQIRAVITDVVMPRSGGVAMFHQIHAINTHMPVIFLTGYDQGRVHLQPDEQPYSAVLAKPIRIATLSHQLRSMLDQTC